MEEQTKRAGHVRKRCFTRAAFRVQTIIKRVVCGYARARLRVYKVWSKSSGEFSRKLFIQKDNTIYESNSRLWKYTYIFFRSSMNYSIHSHLGCTRSFQLASSCVLSFFCFRNSLSLKEYIILYLFLKGREIKIGWGKSQIEMINSMQHCCAFSIHQIYDQLIFPSASRFSLDMH